MIASKGSNKNLILGNNQFDKFTFKNIKETC